jgi:acetoacetyl-[acyl-carrier protein] synthase
MAALGIWHDGWIPGIFTLDEIPPDVHRQHLRFSQAHVEEGRQMAASFINSKGFGGNNATALLLSPDSTLSLLRQRHGEASLQAWRTRREPVQEQAAAYNQAAAAGNFGLRYRFGEGVVEGSALDMTANRLHIPGYGQAVSLDADNPYTDYSD